MHLLHCKGLYARHLVLILWFICSSFGSDGMAYMSCILLLCNGTYAVTFVMFMAYMQCILCNINQ
jgi:glutathione peroxidase-family protein